jgi:hypothetical protein
MLGRSTVWFAIFTLVLVVTAPSTVRACPS